MKALKAFFFIILGLSMLYSAITNPQLMLVSAGADLVIAVALFAAGYR